ncbi:glycosyltransferase family 4 protein [Citrobacter freundii]|uniref:Glycosyltransferase family 4 protein n=2 Tax=Enterobacteriaceae TaxID=543 RepID=A0AAE7GRQ4_CITFR|nr:glycosyltransferase family 4 protein [Citrobacter freundii]QLO12771.1 glycosyltransferase family 4 protein [Citrobacter freundii]
MRTTWHYYQIFLRLKPDLVFNFTPKVNIYSTLAAQFVKAKVVNNIAGLGSLFVSHSLASRIAKLLYRISQPLADFVFFQNEEDRKLFLDAGIVKQQFTDRLPGSGVDLSRFVVTPAPDDGSVRFILVARMLREKGVELYVEAARQLHQQYPNLEFNLLGFIDEDNPSGISRTQIEQWQNDGTINYLGTTDDVTKVLANQDCVVLPSYYREGVPKSLLEAAAMGKPIVTTDNVGCRETVDNGLSGFLCTPNDLLSLKNALDKIITMTHAQRKKFGCTGRIKIENEFDENMIIKAYLSQLTNLTTPMNWN